MIIRKNTPKEFHHQRLALLPYKVSCFSHIATTPIHTMLLSDLLDAASVAVNKVNITYFIVCIGPADAEDLTQY